MDKKELDQLDPIKQIECINNEIIKNTISNVCKSIGIGRTTVSDRFKKVGYVYNKELGQYAKDDTIVIQIHQKNIKAPQTRNEHSVAPTENGITKEMQKYRDDLMELVNYKDDILALLKTHQNNTNVIEVAQLDINSLPEDLQKDIINKSIKVYGPVYKLFDEVCSQYPSYKKQDMISLMIYEFHNKYKK